MVKRSSGILLPISSLPSPYGIGTLGKEAYDFIDFLKNSGQSWWQVLPIGPTSYGDSPYQSFSIFAGNPYFIDLDELVEKGLLNKEEIEERFWGSEEDHVDYGAIFNSRFDVLRLAAERGLAGDRRAFDLFVRENPWVETYAQFMAIKSYFGMKSWTEWDDEDIRMRKSDAVRKYTEKLHGDILFYEYIQFLFDGQWSRLKEYAHKNGVSIIGDVPIYVALDSADVWAEPRFFQLDEKNVPVKVAGVPPDAFTEDGQLWGNPLYDWDAMEKDGFGWWIRRIDGAAKRYDMVRFDHFRGLESYWAVPATEKTAKNGKWVKGPGNKLVSILNSWFHGLKFIAEDLGYITPEVAELLKDSAWPGMRVMEFAWGVDSYSDYLPHNHVKNSICYIGTHDNDTLIGWIESGDRKEVEHACKYLGVKDIKDLPDALIRCAMSSVSMLFIAQIQDYLGIGSEGRVNTPGTAGNNWTWRLKSGQITDALAEKILELTVLYQRCDRPKKKAPEKKETEKEEN
ncbi:MAG: 4-alpha-glucanotransferase [Oscillospiraceae bacterium]|nr:4-alpha-glucanotransferase [Oscillospiraceae bacterium]MBR0451027.1 4-alpha-glucanotransferase [Oscillospiraceae bacterium]